jgi:hypothetical protein
MLYVVMLSAVASLLGYLQFDIALPIRVHDFLARVNECKTKLVELGATFDKYFVILNKKLTKQRKGAWTIKLFAVLIYRAGL